MPRKSKLRNTKRSNLESAKRKKRRMDNDEGMSSSVGEQGVSMLNVSELSELLVRSDDALH